MKGTFFQKPFELTLLVEGESWRQGDPISGELVVRNRGAESVLATGLQVRLVYGSFKKVRQKEVAPADVIASPLSENTPTLSPSQEHRIPWRLTLDQNSAITDKSSSLYLLYGAGTDLAQLGQLQLNVLQNYLIEEFLKELTIHHRFVVKGQKFRKGRVETKLSPPESRAFAAMDHLLLSTRFEDEDLVLDYSFNVKAIDATRGGMDLSKRKKDFTQTLRKSEYLLPSGRTNHERFNSSIRDVLGQQGLGTLIG